MVMAGNQGSSIADQLRMIGVFGPNALVVGVSDQREAEPADSRGSGQSPIKRIRQIPWPIETTSSVSRDDAKNLICFFCGARDGHDAGIKVNMVGKTHEAVEFDLRTRGPLKVFMLEFTSLLVPRCQKCKENHAIMRRQSLKLMSYGILIYVIAAVIIMAFAGVQAESHARSGFRDASNNDMGIAVLFVTILGIIPACGFLIGESVAKQAIDYDIRPLRDYTKYPRTKELLCQGWRYVKEFPAYSQAQSGTFNHSTNDRNDGTIWPFPTREMRQRVWKTNPRLPNCDDWRIGVDKFVVVADETSSVNDAQYTNRVLEMFGIPREMSFLNGSRYLVRVSVLTVDYNTIIGEVLQKLRCDPSLCTLTPFSDSSVGKGMLLKVYERKYQENLLIVCAKVHPTRVQPPRGEEVTRAEDLVANESLRSESNERGPMSSTPTKGTEARPPQPAVIRFSCPSCSKRLKTQECNAGKRVTCPNCGKVLHVPGDAQMRDESVKPGNCGSQSVLPGAGSPGIADVSPDNPMASTAECRDWDRLTDQEVTQVLRTGSTEEKLCGLQACARRGGRDVMVILSVIDLLVDADDLVRERAANVLIEREMMPTVAWKLGFELRERALYPDELAMPLCQFIQKFQASPTLGRDKAEEAVERFRKILATGAVRDKFEERFGYFTRPESTVTQAEYSRRKGDKTLCRQCGKKMAMQPQGPHVRLRCEKCDSTRFEKSSDL
jgi:hypothetical protein